MFIRAKNVITAMGLPTAKVVQIFGLRLKDLPRLKDLLLTKAVKEIFLAHFGQMSNQTDIVNATVC